MEKVVSAFYSVSFLITQVELRGRMQKSFASSCWVQI